MQSKHLVDIFFRSMLINSSLNFKRMQNIGFAYSLLPILGYKKFSPVLRLQFLKRHLSYFSTNPQIVAPIIGVISRLEEGNDAEESGDYIVKIKKSMAGPFAAIGDVFLGKGMCLLASIAAVMASLSQLLSAPLVFIVFYVPPQLWLRIKGFIEGYRQGLNIISFFNALRLVSKAGLLQFVTVGLIGVTSVFWAVNSLHYLFCPINLLERGVFTWVLVVLCYLLIERGVSLVAIVYVFCLLACLIMYAVH
ncbi:MAG: PTS system mannose/fructose/sorbose family transporter subunit IID [Syntrophales bacterium]|nr:PTS system mannose/fructose/sorbose family transporter subunit IID [Syntrophales bacterium]